MKSDKFEGKKFLFSMPRFPNLLPPEGWLLNSDACFGLWYYACIIASQIQNDKDDLVYEGQPYPSTILKNRRQLFSSIATAYGVPPEEMAKHWLNVDMQIRMMNGKPIPSVLKFNSVPEIKSQ